MEVSSNIQNPYLMIPDIFIDKFMPKAEPLFTVIYLYALRLYNNAIEFDNSTIADALKITEADVINAWKYWHKKKVVEYSKTKDKESLMFISLVNPQNSLTKVKKTFFETKPHYTEEEIADAFDTDLNVRMMLSICEQALAKPLTLSDRDMLYGLYKWYGMKVDVIEILVKYCVSKGKSNMRYIEKVAQNWCDEDINTIEKAQEYIIRFDEKFRPIMNAFGVGDRLPQKKEQEFMLNWVDTLNFDMDMIKIACEKTVNQTGKVNFKYADSILTDWHKKGITNKDDVEKDDADFILNNELKDKKADKTKSSFNNYTSDEVDFDSLDILEQKLLEQRVATDNE